MSKIFEVKLDETSTNTEYNILYELVDNTQFFATLFSTNDPAYNLSYNQMLNGVKIIVPDGAIDIIVANTLCSHTTPIP